MTNHTSQRGYSLLELIVSLGIFSVVMLVVTGAYLTLISLDRQARANNQLAATLSFATESMARSMRTGSEYACSANTSSPNCASGGTSISFCLEGQDCRSGGASQYLVTYRLKSDGSIGQCTGSICTDATAVSLTDPRITVDALRFYVRGVGTTGTNAYLQPQVIFVVTGTMATDSGESTSFSIQTAATQRLIEI